MHHSCVTSNIATALPIAAIVNSDNFISLLALPAARAQPVKAAVMLVCKCIHQALLCEALECHTFPAQPNTNIQVLFWCTMARESREKVVLTPDSRPN